jgi:hypothetical protein
MVPASGLEVTGDLKTYEDHGDSGGTVFRKFCPNCGSPVISDIPGLEAQGVRVIKGRVSNQYAFRPNWLLPPFPQSVRLIRNGPYLARSGHTLLAENYFPSPHTVTVMVTDYL